MVRHLRRGEQGSSFYYIIMLVPVLLMLLALSRGAQRVVVYVDPENRKFTVVRAGLIFSKERISTAVSNVTGVSTETKVVYDKAEESGDTVRRTKTALIVKTDKGVKKLWSYSKAANAQKADRLVEQLLKT